MFRVAPEAASKQREAADAFARAAEVVTSRTALVRPVSHSPLPRLLRPRAPSGDGPPLGAAACSRSGDLPPMPSAAALGGSKCGSRSREGAFAERRSASAIGWTCRSPSIDRLLPERDRCGQLPDVAGAAWRAQRRDLPAAAPAQCLAPAAGAGAADAPALAPASAPARGPAATLRGAEWPPPLPTPVCSPPRPRGRQGSRYMPMDRAQGASG